MRCPRFPPDHEPVGFPEIKAGYGVGKASQADGTLFGMPQMARGPALFTPNPSFDQHQTACKPGSVGPRPFALTRRDGHSSGTTLARCFEQPTRTASLTSLPRVLSHHANSPRCRPYSVLLPVGFTMPVPLPEPRCALTAPFHPCCPPFREEKRFILCGTFPGVAPAGRYPAPYVDGARTFLSLRPFGHDGSGRPAD